MDKRYTFIFAERLKTIAVKTLKKKKGMTEKAAEKHAAKYITEQLNKQGFDTSWSTVKRWLNGQYVPETGTLYALADIFAPYGIDYLLGLIDEPNEENKTAAEYTGLSPIAIERIRELPSGASRVLNTILTNEETASEFDKLLAGLHLAIIHHDILTEREQLSGQDEKLAADTELYQYAGHRLADKALLAIESTIPLRGSSIWDKNKNRPNESERR